MLLVGLVLAGINMTLASHAYASTVGEGYATPNMKEMAQTFLMTGGLDISKDDVADEYMHLLYCKLYEDKYNNDFEWHKYLHQVQSRVQEKLENYRVFYQVRGQVDLGRYDFTQHLFPLTPGTAMKNVGVLNVYDGNSVKPDICEPKSGYNYIPYIYYFQLDRPLNITRLKLPEKQAKYLLDMLNKLGGEDNRTVYLRLRLRVSEAIGITGRAAMRTGVMRAQLMGIDFFIDPDMTMHIVSVPVLSAF